MLFSGAPSLLDSSLLGSNGFPHSGRSLTGSDVSGWTGSGDEAFDITGVSDCESSVSVTGSE